MNSNSMKTYPEIRFPGFTDAWEQRKLGDIASFGGGHTPSMADPTNYSKNGLLWITSQDVKTDYLYETTTHVSNKGASELNLYPEGTLVMVTRSGILRHTLPVSMLVKPATVNQDIRTITPTEDCDSIWLLQFFKAASKSLLKRFGKTGTTVESIDFSNIKTMCLCIPELDEQRKIASLFKLVDDAITFHQRKCDELKNYKKGLLQQMFPLPGESTPRIRFPGFTDPWEQRKLGDIVDRVTRKNTNNESELPLTISAQYGLIDQMEFFGKRIASRDISGYYLLFKGEFAYNKSTSGDAPWGAVKRLDRYENGAVSTLYITFAITDPKQTDSDFIACYYDTDLWHKGVQAVAAEGARNHGLLNIAPADFFNTTLMMPVNIEEQKAIGRVLKRVDNLITLHQRKCDELVIYKKGLLQKMFI